MDAPKTLGNAGERACRQALLRAPHINALTILVDELRDSLGPGYLVPYFDPLDGGVRARVLYLLEAPGRKAVQSGFVSRNNPDETAKNFFLLNAEAGIPREATVIWNAVPWYIGTSTRIRAANVSDVARAEDSLKRLLHLLTNLAFVVFVGTKARHARSVVARERPDVRVREIPHPSPMFVNRAPENRDRILFVLKELSTQL